MTKNIVEIKNHDAKEGGFHAKSHLVRFDRVFARVRSVVHGDGSHVSAGRPNADASTEFDGSGHTDAVGCSGNADLGFATGDGGAADFTARDEYAGSADQYAGAVNCDADEYAGPADQYADADTGSTDANGDAGSADCDSNPNDGAGDANGNTDQHAGWSNEHANAYADRHVDSDANGDGNYHGDAHRRSHGNSDGNGDHHSHGYCHYYGNGNSDASWSEWWHQR